MDEDGDPVETRPKMAEVFIQKIDDFAYELGRGMSRLWLYSSMGVSYLICSTAPRPAQYRPEPLPAYGRVFKCGVFKFQAVHVLCEAAVDWIGRLRDGTIEHIHAAAAAVVAASASLSSTASLKLEHISDAQMQQEVVTIIDHALLLSKQYGFRVAHADFEKYGDDIAYLFTEFGLRLMRLPRNLVGILADHLMGMRTGLMSDLKPTAAAISAALVSGVGAPIPTGKRKRPGPQPMSQQYGGTASKHLDASVCYSRLRAVHAQVVECIDLSLSGVNRSEVWNFSDRGMLRAVNEAVRVEIEKGNKLREAAAPLDLRKMTKKEKAAAKSTKAAAEIRAKAARAEERARRKKVKDDALAAKIAARAERRAQKARELEAKKARSAVRAVKREAQEVIRLKKNEERLQRKIEEQKKRDKAEHEMKLMRQKMQEKQIKSAAEKRGGARFYRGIEGEDALRADHMWEMNAPIPSLCSFIVDIGPGFSDEKIAWVQRETPVVAYSAKWLSPRIL